VLLDGLAHGAGGLPGNHDEMGRVKTVIAGIVVEIIVRTSTTLCRAPSWPRSCNGDLVLSFLSRTTQ
jgi:hypothetical protein